MCTQINYNYLVWIVLRFNILKKNSMSRNLLTDYDF